MISPAQNESDLEPGKKHHRVAVENLAEHLHKSVEGVNAVYGIVLRYYWRTARIKYFLSALVSKRVKELLKDDKKPSALDGGRSHRREL